MAVKIFLTGSVVFQEVYIKKICKPRNMIAKQWINRLEEMREYLYWLSENNCEMSNLTFNKDCIKSSIPLEWPVTFEESEITRNINQSIHQQQPKVREILDVLEQIENSEQIQKQVEDLKNRRKDKHKDRHGGDRTNMCRIPGHNHKWKDCLMSPANTNQQEHNAHEKETHQDDDDIIEQEDFSMRRKHNILNFMEDSSNSEASIKDSTIVPDIYDKKKNDVTDTKAHEMKTHNKKEAVRASYLFELQDGNGKVQEYLDLIDT